MSLFVGSPKFVGVVSGRFETQIQYDAELKNTQNILADKSIYMYIFSGACQIKNMILENILLQSAQSAEHLSHVLVENDCSPVK